MLIPTGGHYTQPQTRILIPALPLVGRRPEMPRVVARLKEMARLFPPIYRSVENRAFP